jgi:hypothetical protein
MFIDCDTKTRRAPLGAQCTAPHCAPLERVFMFGYSYKHVAALRPDLLFVVDCAYCMLPA